MQSKDALSDHRINIDSDISATKSDDNRFDLLHRAEQFVCDFGLDALWPDDSEYVGSFKLSRAVVTKIFKDQLAINGKSEDNLTGKQLDILLRLCCLSSSSGIVPCVHYLDFCKVPGRSLFVPEASALSALPLETNRLDSDWADICKSKQTFYTAIRRLKLLNYLDYRALGNGYFRFELHDNDFSTKDKMKDYVSLNRRYFSFGQAEAAAFYQLPLSTKKLVLYLLYYSKSGVSGAKERLFRITKITDKIGCTKRTVLRSVFRLCNTLFRERDALSVSLTPLNDTGVIVFDPGAACVLSPFRSEEEQIRNVRTDTTYFSHTITQTLRLLSVRWKPKECRLLTLSDGEEFFYSPEPDLPSSIQRLKGEMERFRSKISYREQFALFAYLAVEVGEFGERYNNLYHTELSKMTLFA